MAKKVAPAYNMSEELLNLIAENPQISTTDAWNALVDKYPNEPINENSFSVAFYTSRKKLGIGQKKSSKKWSSWWRWYWC